MSDDIRKNLEMSLDEAEWSWLAPHHARGAVVLVSRELDLLAAGEKIARDAKDEVQEWLKKGWLTRPTESQVAAWAKSPSRKFLCLIVQPWVLAQEPLLH